MGSKQAVRNRRNQAVVLCMVFGMLASASLVVPARGEVTDDQIVDTINKQITYLLSKQEGDNWEPHHKFGAEKWMYTGGQTSLVLYALLYAGRSIHDDRLNPNGAETVLKPSLAWLSKVGPDQADPFSTYAASLQINALALVPDAIKIPAYKAAITKAATFLVKSMRTNGEYSYFWQGEVGRPMNFDGHRGESEDNSNGQYGLLGVWAAQDAGIEISPSYWTIANAHWRKTQDAEGGWGYHNGEGPYLNMVAAGLASLYITTECTDMDPPLLVGKPEPGIDKGLAWMDEHFTADTDAYGLYGCERVGLASGYKYFGTKNWYQMGAEHIIENQNDDGSSRLEVKYVNNGEDPIPATCYSLLFLCRGRNPVFFNKLEYHDPKDPKPLIWNARPRDLANLAHWSSKKFEEDFNWHVVNLQVSAEDWLDSPVLLITGSKDPNFTAEDVAKLKTFVNDGGTIFSSSDGSSAAFDDAMRKYAGQIVDRQYEMRELPKDHPLYSIQYNVADSAHLLSMSNGIRELWIHSTGDLGAIWQRRAYAHLPAWEVPTNVYLYATGKVNSREKYPTLVVKPGTGGTTRNIAMARVEYAGNWDPEPGAWPRMSKLAAASFHTALTVNDVKVFNLNAKDTPIAHMTGTAGFSLSTDNVDMLRKYLESGGTLLVDAGDGSETFINSFNKLAADLFPKDVMDDVPADNPLITGQGMTDGGDISDVEYRKSTLKRHSRPPLTGLKHDGRYVILMSPFDLTSGLLGTNTWGIKGYTPDSAQAIARNLLLFAATPVVSGNNK